MAETKKIRFIARAGDPRNGGGIIQPGTVADFPAVWAERYIAQGIAVEAGEPEPKPAARPKKKK